MKKICSLGILIIILSLLMVQNAFNGSDMQDDSSKIITPKESEVSIIFQDDFESYPVNSFPTGYILTYNGAGDSYQKITDEQASSGTQSFTLTGQDYWLAAVDKQIQYSSNILTLEANLMSETPTGIVEGGKDNSNIKISFTNPTASTWGRNYASLVLNNDGGIYLASTSPNIFLGNYIPFTWYNLKMIVNISSWSVKAYLDNIYVGESSITNDPTEITHVRITSGHQGITGYVDDIKCSEGMVDINPINVSIISPTHHELFQETAPNFEIYIDDPDLNSTWYSLDSGITNILFIGFTGTIDQTEWNKMPNGTVVIGFYANDSTNHISYESVTVRKDILGPIIIVNSPQMNEVEGQSAPYYDLSIIEHNLNAMWYSFDYGETVLPLYSFIGILDQSTWETKDGGTIPIRFYANDSLGHESYVDVFVIKDLIIPLVSINSPDSYNVFGNIPPVYDISITESNLKSYWYTLNGGITNITIYSLTGSIAQSEWDKYGNGTVTIRFFAEDEGGNKGSAEIVVRKDINLPLIAIISPQLDAILGFQTPQFQLSIVEPNIDIMWYTLDGGVTTYSFTEFTGQIDEAEWAKYGHGTVLIRFHVRDKAGNEAFAEVQVTKDLISPVITISAPQFGTVFTDFSPLYSISIDEANLESYWYSLDGGATNISISSLNGVISESAWNSLPNGHVTLTFYARDKGGNIGQNSVLITKNTTEQTPTPPAIPGYNTFIIIGFLVIISTLLINKRFKS
ncbi:MAG: hypothetical protein ACFFBH_15190 [Promethearchaeota archaeon]